MATDERQDVEVREGRYGDRVIAVEPGGAEFIPLNERHGRPVQLFWTWTSPNMEFATIFVGVLAIAAFHLGFWEAFAAILLGSALGGLTQGLLSARGPVHGVPQMVLSRLGFGHWGNILPAGINAVVAGIGWFAVNSISGALALHTLTGWPLVVCLLIVVVVQIVLAFAGHNLIHVFERFAFPVLAIIFLVASGVILSKTHPSASHSSVPGAFLIELGATFGYAVGWNPYAADYTRYYRPDANRRAIGWWAGIGLFLSCALLETVGAAAATAVTDAGAFLGADPTGAFTGELPSVLAKFTLAAIAIGAVAANALNIYSGAISFNALGFRLPLHIRRAIVALGFGTIGFFLAWSQLGNAGTTYNNFLLIIAYWIAPWLAVMFCDQLLRRREEPGHAERLLFDKKHANWAGPVAMAVGAGVSVWLFSNQTEYTGLVPRHVPAVGDLTFEAGFVLTAAIYLSWKRITWHQPLAKGRGAHARRRGLRTLPAPGTRNRQVLRGRRPRLGRGSRRHRRAARPRRPRPADVQGHRRGCRHRGHIHRQPVLDVQGPGEPVAAARRGALRRAQPGRPADRRGRDRGHDLRARLPRPARVQRGERDRHRARDDLPLLRLQALGLPETRDP
ncbi:MAG TPA: cytosine permease [Trebonia sp.]|jgi:NCS1 nucleoside transporter family|nr:cytosine permease [Trebonia sp.]